MACAGDDILLHARGEHREVRGVSSNADYQIPVLLFVDLCVEQRLLVDNIELNVLSAIEEIGLIFTSYQILDLIANDVDGIHIYSMNKSDFISKLMDNIGYVASGFFK